MVDGNRARQLLALEERASLFTNSGQTKVTTGRHSFRVLRRKASVEEGERVLIVPPGLNLDTVTDLREIRGVRWFGHLAPRSPSDVLKSLKDAFHYLADDPDVGVCGLRDPQLGALHSVLGYWTTRTSTPATVVMPTGTGKTETMLALFASARLPRLLVVVPSDALRDQVADKFETLGILQDFGVVAKNALRPIVGRIRHRFASECGAREFAEACNVIVTTPNSLSASPPDVRAALVGRLLASLRRRGPSCCSSYLAGHTRRFCWPLSRTVHRHTLPRGWSAPRRASPVRLPVARGSAAGLLLQD